VVLGSVGGFGEPSIEGLHNHFCHRCWGMILGEMVQELALGFVARIALTVAGTLEYMINVLFQASTWETASVNTVVLSCSLVRCWGPVVGILGELELSTF
jgi:hypothetical protein